MMVMSITVIVYSPALVAAFIFIHVVLPFPLFVLLIFLIFAFQRDSSPGLQLFEAKWVVSQSLHGCLLLLHDGK